MRSGKVINTVLISAVVVLLGGLAFSVRIRPTPDSAAVLSTAGMTCGACGAAIERALQREKGVASVEVDVAEGRVVVGFDGKQIRPERLAATVTGAGYRSVIERVLTIDQFRAMTGKSPGNGQTMRLGCDCCNRSKSRN